jgi:hypothetical protein
MFSRCANPECLTPFDHRLGGQFFRFHKSHRTGESVPNTHSVQHFWLCQGCSLTHTLEYEMDQGVVIKLRFKEEIETNLPRLIAAA